MAVTRRKPKQLLSMATTHIHLDGSGVGDFLGVTSPSLVEAVREGFPYEVFERLRSLLGVTARELSELLKIPERTLQRRRVAGRLLADESDRLLRVARVVELATVVFDDDQAKAMRWLNTPKTLLGGESPLVRLDTGPGAREVEDMLFAIEFSMPA